MGHDNDNDGIGATGCLILLALAAAFWAGIYGLVILLALAAAFWGAVYCIIISLLALAAAFIAFSIMHH